MTDWFQKSLPSFWSTVCPSRLSWSSLVTSLEDCSHAMYFSRWVYLPSHDYSSFPDPAFLNRERERSNLHKHLTGVMTRDLKIRDRKDDETKEVVSLDVVLFFTLLSIVLLSGMNLCWRHEKRNETERTDITIQLPVASSSFCVFIALLEVKESLNRMTLK